MNEQIVSCGIFQVGGNTQVSRPFAVDGATGAALVGLIGPDGTVEYITTLHGWFPTFTPGADEYWLLTASAQYVLDGDNNLDVVRKNGGSPTIQADIVVGVASTAIAAANNNRRSLLIQNNGTVDIWLRWGAAAVLSTRQKIAPGQTMQWAGESCPSDALNGIASIAAQNLYVMET